MVSRRMRRAVPWTLVAVVAMALAVTLGTGGAGASYQAKSYPRAATLITSGTQWGNIAGMNPWVGNYAAGMVGLVNETLLRFDPLKDTYIPWLARSAKWTGAKQYTIVVRNGVKWSNGQPFTGSDVAYNLNLGRFSTAGWNNLWVNLKQPIQVKGNTVVVNFKTTPNYVQWQNALWFVVPMVYPGQAKVITTPQQFTTYNPHSPIGTGPYKLDTSGFDVTTRVVWAKRAHWWASDLGIAPSPAPKYIIDLVNTSNTNSLSAVLAGVEDLNNNYLPGVSKLVDSGKVHTYFPKAPYMLSANTAWLEPNTSVTPLNDPVFRKALAMSINLNKIVTDDYGHLVLKASPTGLLPTWKKYVSAAAVKQYGFKYDPAAAKALLQKAGYKLSGGYFANKDGSKIDLDISVPQGWSDWEAARDMIVASAKDAGIRIHAAVKDFNTWQTDRNTGKFDLVVDNAYQLSDNPWSYWNGIFHLPVITAGTGQTFANFERYSNPTAWALTQKLDKTPPSDTKAIAALNVQLQTTLMKDLPLIPLWYNGIWSQTTTKYWTNWPAGNGDRQFVPAMWRGYMQMTGIDMITHLKSTERQVTGG
jgi:peptide/nickel transport system substrate-binding protein